MPSRARECAGRALATRLSVLPGFIACVAIEDDAGAITALCIVEDQTGIAAATSLTAQWHRDHTGTAGTGVQTIGSGELIAQQGL
jgi:hypothetical protein